MYYLKDLKGDCYGRKRHDIIMTEKTIVKKKIKR